jgi:hypothetical protein
MSPAADPADFSRRLDEAAAHFAAGDLDAAGRIYRRLEREAPADIRAAYSLSVIDIRRGRLREARVRLEAVTAREPGLFTAQHNLGSVCQQTGAWREAAEAFGRALALRPDAAETRHGLATALAVLGRGGEAIAHHRTLAGDPDRRWAALTRIALIDAGAIGEEEIAPMSEAAADAALETETRIGLNFALGDVLERRGDHARAFAAYAAGNRLKRASLVGAARPEVVADANAAAIRYVEELFSRGFIAKHEGRGSRSAAPIFVVGMPRSGSTLIEQILASHPGVHGLGETGVLPDLMTAGYPTTSAGFRDLAARYLAAMRERGWDGASRFVDKTLENYLHVGAIHVMFPRAVILHAVRDPMDVCFACWRQLFSRGNETLYDLADIAAEYQSYRQLMNHWAAVLPGGIVEVSYEALVADPETRIPALVTEAAGLAWDAACLRFFEREGAVATASAAQVRQPIFKDGVQRWRPHAANLAPLIEALGPWADSPNVEKSGANDGT